MPHDLPVLRDLVILAGFALAATLLFQRLRVPAVTGFIVTGVLIGPGGLGLVRDLEAVVTLAEIGVVLLLFTVGLEFSLTDLRELGGRSLAAGALQLALTTALVAPLLLVVGAHPARALFFGLLVSLSSTALLLKLLAERAELFSPHGRLTVGILLFQDLALVPLTVLTPLLGAWAEGAGASPLVAGDVVHALTVIVLAGLVFLAARRAVPWLLRQASRTGTREAFLAAVALVALGSAWLSQLAGLSLALGAFLAGLILAGSEVRSQVVADVLPFRDSLASVFFISIGMLFAPAEALRSPGLTLAVIAGVVVLKAVAACLAGRAVGVPWTVAIAAGVPLAHVGEFSFVLARTGTSAGLLPPPWDQAFLTAALTSIVIAPWLVAAAPAWGMRIGLRWARVSPAARVAGVAGFSAAVADAADAVAGDASVAGDTGAGAQPGAAAARASALACPLLAHHVMIAGFGLNGSNLARVLRAVRIPHIVLDLAPDKVAACTAQGSPALLGNAGQPEILRQAGVARARVLVLALSDPFATRHAARLARDLNQHLFIVVRTRYVKEMDGFYQAGANVVIPEEFETSIEIFVAVLRQFHVPNHVIDAQVDLLRRERYSLLRGLKLPGSVLEQLDTILTQGTTETVLVMQHSPAVGRSLEELGLVTSGAGTRLVAVVRGGHAITSFDADFRIRVGDTLVLTGTHVQIDRAVDRLAPRAEEAAAPHLAT